MWQLLRPVSLVTVAVLALAMAAAVRAFPFGAALLVILLSWTAKYSIAALNSFANGGQALPVLTVEMIFGSLRDWRLLLALGLCVVLFFSIASALGLYSYRLLILFAALLPIVLPAMLAVQAWTNSTPQAVQPAILIGMARLLGPDYMRLAGIAAVLVVAVAVAATRFPYLSARIATYLLCWFTLVTVIGQAVRARRKDLEAATFFPAAVDLADSAQQLASARERAADEIYALWRSGAKHEAWERALAHVEAARQPAEELAWLARRVSNWDAKPLEERVHRALDEALRRKP